MLGITPASDSSFAFTSTITHMSSSLVVCDVRTGLRPCSTRTSNEMPRIRHRNTNRFRPTPCRALACCSHHHEPVGAGLGAPHLACSPEQLTHVCSRAEAEGREPRRGEIEAIALLAKSVSHTMSFRPRQRRRAGRPRETPLAPPSRGRVVACLPAFHSLTHSRRRESEQGSGGTLLARPQLPSAIPATWLPASRRVPDLTFRRRRRDPVGPCRPVP